MHVYDYCYQFPRRCTMMARVVRDGTSRSIRKKLAPIRRYRLIRSLAWRSNTVQVPEYTCSCPPEPVKNSLNEYESWEKVINNAGALSVARENNDRGNSIFHRTIADTFPSRSILWQISGDIQRRRTRGRYLARNSSSPAEFRASRGCQDRNF